MKKYTVVALAATEKEMADGLTIAARLESAINHACSRGLVFKQAIPFTGSNGKWKPDYILVYDNPSVNPSPEKPNRDME